MTTAEPNLHPVPNGRDGGGAAPIGEVIESSTTSFLAQACQLDGAPPFGSFVRVAGDDGLTAIGVVGHVETAGIDASARPVMRGYGDIRDGRIYEENPDLPHVLRTTFRSLVVGYGWRGTYRQVLPPRPPRLHYSVHAAAPGEVRAFTEVGLDYLGTLLAADEALVVELVAANVRRTGALRAEPEDFTRSAGRELARLLRSDYARLASILRRTLPEQGVDA